MRSWVRSISVDVKVLMAENALGPAGEETRPRWRRAASATFENVFNVESAIASSLFCLFSKPPSSPSRHTLSPSVDIAVVTMRAAQFCDVAPTLLLVFGTLTNTLSILATAASILFITSCSQTRTTVQPSARNKPSFSRSLSTFPITSTSKTRHWFSCLSVTLRLEEAACSHPAIRTGSGRQAARMASFKWVNTTLGNIKSAITGTYRKLGPDHAGRYLASFAWRYNRRYQLQTIIPRFVHSAARTQPMPYRLLIAG